MQDVEELLNTVLSRETLTGLNLLLAVRKVVNVLGAHTLLTLLSDGRGDLSFVSLLVIVGLEKNGLQDKGEKLRSISNPFLCARLCKSKHSRPRAPPLPLLPPQRAPLFLLPQSRRREHCESKWVSMRWRGVGCQWANRHFHAKLTVHLATLFLAPSFASPPAFGLIHHPSHSFLFISTIASLIACAHTQSLVLYSRRDEVRDEAGEKAGGLLLLLNGGSGGLLCHVVGGHFGSGGGDLGFVEREDVVVVERRGIPAKVIGSSAFT